MARTLITGMSATGKSTTICELAALGHRAVDLDTAEWSHLVPDDSDYADRRADGPLDWRWRERKVRDLFTAEQGSWFVAGTSTYQARLYPLLHHIVLLTVPSDVAMTRLANRDTNDYGKEPGELRRELHLRMTVEPMLRAGACLVIDTSVYSPADVAGIIVDHVDRSPLAAHVRISGN
jgi:hypothetical protein